MFRAIQEQFGRKAVYGEWLVGDGETSFEQFGRRVQPVLNRTGVAENILQHRERQQVSTGQRHALVDHSGVDQSGWGRQHAPLHLSTHRDALVDHSGVDQSAGGINTHLSTCQHTEMPS